jgi:Cu(I)/Ag(I) efflux system membrane fusion protein
MKRWLIIPLFLLATFAAGLWFWPGKGSGIDRQLKTKRIRGYQDSMHPWIKSDRPGTCSVCGMQLTPIFEREGPMTKLPTLITLSRSAVTVANVAVEVAHRRDVHRLMRVSGVFEAQESRTAVLAAPAGGRVDYIAVDQPGTQVQQGETLVRLFSPDLTQRNRFLRGPTPNQPAWATPSKPGPLPATDVTPMHHTTNENTASAAGGYRLDLFLSDLVAPITGTVSERPVTLGQYVMEGQKIATIIDISVLWFRFDAFDRQLRWIVPGQRIEIHTESALDQAWIGAVSLVEPVAPELRGFAKVRAVVTNTPARSDFGAEVALRPGMLGEGRIQVVLPNVLAVPKSAVIYPGASARVYVEQDAGSYERRPIRLGQEADDGWEVLSGLKEGELVVTTGNVLIDAQATIENRDEPTPTDQETVTLENVVAAMNRPITTNSANDPCCSGKVTFVPTGRKSD